MRLMRLVFALATTAILYFLFYNASIMVQDYSVDPFGLIRPWAWLAPFLTIFGLLVSGLAFLLIMLPSRGGEKRKNG